MLSTRFQCGRVSVCVFLIAILLAGLPAFIPFADALDCLSLEGSHPFSSGDNPIWSAPSFDDSRWKTVRIPGDLKAQGVQQKPGTGWYRIHFVAPNDLLGVEAGLRLGHIGNADDVYLNGVRIGGEGIIGDRFVEAPWKERLYRVPDGLLRFGQDNVLAVRILDTYRMAGIFEGPVCLGDYRNMILGSRDQAFLRKGCEIAFFTLLFFCLLVSVFLMVQKVPGPDYFSFTLFLALYMALFVLESLYVYDAGLKSPLVQRVIFSITSLLPAAGLYFIANLYPSSRELWNRMLLGASVGLSAAFLFFPGLAPYTLLLTAFLVLAACTGATTLFLTIRSFFHHRQESGPVLLGLFGLLSGLFAEWTPLGGHWHQWPVSPGDLGMAFLVASMSYALVARYARNAEAVKTLSGRILEAHEEERKRLSRNIHDGLGQFLPMIKLQIQMLEAKVKSGKGADPSVLAALVTEISRAIVDLRHMVADIRPEFFEQTPLADTLNWYGRQFSERTGIEVLVHVSIQEDLIPRIRENLYRIVQETLHNVEKHAGACRVEIEMSQRKKNVILKIRDNGRGFFPASVDKKKGIGLLSMKERAELMGGTFQIQSEPGKGCTIEVEAPVS